MMTEPITSDELAAMRACWEASTPGEWDVCLGSGNNCCTWVCRPETETEPFMFVADCLPDIALETPNEVEEDHRPNLNFIANAHQYVPRLLDEVERLRDQLFHAGCDLNILWGGIQGRDEEIARLQAQLAVKDGAGMRLIEYIVPQQEEIDLLRQRVAELEAQLEVKACKNPAHWSNNKREVYAAVMDDAPLPKPKRCPSCGHNPNAHYTDGELKV